MAEKTHGPGLGSGQRFTGIDQSLRAFGLTFMSEDGGFETYVLKDPPGKGIDRLLYIEEWLTRRLTEAGDVSNVAIESPVLRSSAALMSGQLFGIVLRTLRTLYEGWGRSSYPLQVSPGTLKKYVTGKGNIDKNLILLHTFKKWGVEFDDDNAADSYGLARIAAGMADLAYEKAVLKGLQDPKYRGPDFK